MVQETSDDGCDEGSPGELIEERTKPKLKLKWLEPNHDKAKRSNKNERRLAKQLSGRRVVRSGGTLWSRRAGGSTGSGTTKGGDVETKDFFIENKRTEKASMSVKHEWLDGIRTAAARVMKDPALIITFEFDRRPPEDWVAVPIAVFERLRAKDRQ